MTDSAEYNRPGQHHFDRWRFNADTGDLFDGEDTIHLEPQVAKLLAYFLDHQNVLISREALMDAVWEQRIVSDDAINRCISILRHILTPEDKNAWIETVVRRGFLSHFPAAAPDEPAEKNPRRRNASLAAAALAVLVVVILFGIALKNPGQAPRPEETRRQSLPLVAVLPFSASGQGTDTEFFANGMHDDLLTQLAQLQSLRVISRTSVLEYRDTRQNAREIGRELGVDAILEGGIQRAGDQIHINMQLIDARTDEHLWAGQYDRELRPANIFRIQAEIAEAVAMALQTTLTGQDAKQLQLLPTQNMAAYRAYHQALEIRDASLPTNPAYIAALEKAVTLDPAFVRAWAELAGALSYANFEQQNPEAVRRAEQILEQIRSLAPQSADYLIAQSYYTYYVLRNYDQAYQLITQAQNLRPGDARLWELKSYIARRAGDFDGKIESLRMVRTLDPRNPRWTQYVVESLIANHQYDEASREVQEAGTDSFGVSVLGSMLQLRKHHDFEQWLASLQALQKEFDVSTDSPELWDAYIATRNYPAAAKIMTAEALADPNLLGWRSFLFTEVNIRPIITLWFMKADARLEPVLSMARNALETQQYPDGDLHRFGQYLVMAFVAAAEGNTEETERLVRSWRRKTDEDLAELISFRHFACRALGMAAATPAAVECIRTGLAEPSYVMPFMEPFLPYYDSIRDEPEFVALLAEIQHEAESEPRSKPH